MSRASAAGTRRKGSLSSSAHSRLSVGDGKMRPVKGVARQGLRCTVLFYIEFSQSVRHGAADWKISQLAAAVRCRSSRNSLQGSGVPRCRGHFAGRIGQGRPISWLKQRAKLALQFAHHVFVHSPGSLSRRPSFSTRATSRVLHRRASGQRPQPIAQQFHGEMSLGMYGHVGSLRK